MTRRVAGLLCAAVLPYSATAHAASVYLVCSFPEKAGHDIHVTADEANQSASVYLPSTGRSMQFRAAFTPNSVAFEDRLLQYLLSRTDLTIRRTIKMLKGHDSAVEIGQCRIEAAPRRAF